MRGRLDRCRALIRQLVADHRLFCVALGAGAFVRLLVMIGYPGALWFAGDSYVYVGAALRPVPDLSKTTGYSLFLRMLEPLHSFIVVTAVQHLCGLAVGVLVYALARRAGVSERWSVAAALPVLLDGYQIEDEHMVMAEAVFTLLIVIACALILWRRRMNWAVAILAGLLAGYAVIVRSEGLPVLVLFPLAIVLRDWRRWRQWLAAALMAAGCLIPVGGYVAWFHQHNGTYGLTRSDGFYLWGRMSSFADCAVIKPPAYDLPICPQGSPRSRTAPGDFVWHAANVHGMAGGGPVTPANNKLLRDFAIRAVLAQPFDYAKAIAHGLLLAVRWPRVAYPDPGTVSYYKFTRVPQQIPADHSWIPGGTAYSDAVAYGHATPSRVVVPVATADVAYQRIVYTYGPLFGLIMVLGLGGLVRVRFRPVSGRPFSMWRRWSSFSSFSSWRSLSSWWPVSVRWCRRSGSMLPWVTAVALLVFPIATADFDYRYLLPVLPFAGLAAALAFGPARPATDEKLDKWQTSTSAEPAGSSSSRA